MFPGFDEARKWIGLLKGTLVALFHERLTDPEKNEALFREDLTRYDELKEKIQTRLSEMAVDLGWDSTLLRQKTTEYGARLKLDWLDRAIETHELAKKGSRYIGAPLTRESECFPD